MQRTYCIVGYLSTRYPEGVQHHSPGSTERSEVSPWENDDENPTNAEKGCTITKDDDCRHIVVKPFQGSLLMFVIISQGGALLTLGYVV